MLSQQSGEVPDWSETEIPFFRLGLSILRRVLSLAVESDELDRNPALRLGQLLKGVDLTP